MEDHSYRYRNKVNSARQAHPIPTCKGDVDQNLSLSRTFFSEMRVTNAATANITSIFGFGNDFKSLNVLEPLKNFWMKLRE